MTKLAKTICWNPNFHIVNPVEDRFILVGETESYLLQGEHYQGLFPCIDGSGTIVDIFGQCSDVRTQAILLNTIDELMKKNLIHEEGYKDKTIYYRPDFDSEPLVLRLYDGLIELWVLSEFDDPDFLVQWVKQLNVARPTGVVITDDYLDPRLSNLNRVFRHEKRSWLLIKPTGKRPLIGPCFTPENSNTPCWHCLSHRILHNQPVRKWLQNMQNNGTMPIPVGYEKETVKKVVSAALEQARRFVDQQISSFLLAVDTKSLSFTEHPVSLLPECSCCGDPGISAQRGKKPITLNPGSKVCTTDGGVRSVHPRQTIEKLQPSISPITGIIGDLSLLPDQKEKGVPIYRTFFFKTPAASHKPDNNSFMQISLGKGMSEEQSKAGALCESVERHAVQYRGDEPFISSPASGSDFQAVLPHQLAAFSEAQYRRFGDPRHPDSRVGYAVSKYNENIPLRWIPAWSLADRKPYYIPFTFCYANTPFEDERFSRFNSNGCAAGNTLEEALLQGFLELVERDATAIWWYNKIVRPPVSVEMLPDENLLLLRRTLADEWDYWVLDLTHDFDIPVMAAVSRHKKTKTYRLGFGCHINPVLACQRSLTELCQLIAIKNRGPAIFDFDRIVDEPFLLPEENTPEKKLSDFIVEVHADIRDDILYCVEKAIRLGFGTLAVDYTRPDIPIHTARVIVPGLCHIWPQFGNERLYKVPVKMGWNGIELSEDQLNSTPLLI